MRDPMKDPMKVIVLSREEAKQYSLKPHVEKSIVISINDRENEPNDITADVKFNGIYAVKWVFFDDVKTGDGTISAEQAREIAQFVLDYEERIEMIIVHCGAGVSRSSGCAAAILKALNGSASQVVSNPAYQPNVKVYMAVLEQFYNLMG